MDIGLIIWILVIVGGVYIAYDLLFAKKQKPYADICILEQAADGWMPHRVAYKSYIQNSKNNDDKAQVSWLLIKKLNRFSLVPKKKYVYRDNKGNRRIYMAWYGQNKFVPITIDEFMFKLKKKQKNKDNNIEYVCDKIDSPELKINTEELSYQSRMMDENRNAQFRKQDFMEKWKPIIVMGVLGMMIALILYAGGQQIVKQSEVLTGEAKADRQLIKDWLTSQSQLQIDDNTKVTQSKPSEQYR
jgi:hypothetical protein